MGQRGTREWAFGDPRLARAFYAYCRWFVSPHPRTPPTEEAFCKRFQIDLPDLARFESARFFDENIQRAIVQVGALQLTWLLDDLKEQGDKASGRERALWRETYLRIIAPKVMESDPFQGWHAGEKPAVGRPPKK